jgi:long-chain fatty acid transport protein
MNSNAHQSGQRTPICHSVWGQSITVFALHAVLACLVIAPFQVLGEGFRNPPPSSFGLGRAGGRIAQVDDSAAVNSNPANLVDVHGLELQLTPSVVYIDVDYTSPANGKVSTVHPWKLLPNAYGSYEILPNRLTVGVGLTVPYGLANEWDSSTSSPLRYSAPYYTELKTINLNPSAALRINDKLSIGAGLDVMYSELVFKQFLSPFFPGFNFKAKGTGFGFSGNAGITFNLTDHQRIALTVRAPMNVDYDGHLDFSNEPFTGGSSRTDFGSQIRYPTIVSVGYGISLTETIRLESDVEWLQFSRFKNLPVTVGSNPYLSSLTIPQNWRDTFTAGIAGDWRFAPNWILRAGYQFYLTPVPDSTFSPTIPDANQNVLTIGVGYKHKGHSLEFAYGLDFYDQRDIKNDVNPAFNGTYKFNVHLFSAAYRLAF